VAKIELRELMRIERKAKEHGRGALETWELMALTRFEERLSGLKLELSSPEAQEGFEMWEALSPEDQERYADWTPRQLYAFISP
jgi:hypothetical protein